MTEKVKTYTVTINEDQRILIVQALRSLAQGDDCQELLDLFKTLPEEEEISPGVIHGLCY